MHRELTSSQRQPKRHLIWLFCIISLGAAFGCAEDSTSSGIGDISDRGIDIDATRDAFIVGGRDSRTDDPDQELAPDAAISPCLSQGTALATRYESQPIEHATALYARYEHNGDQTPEFVVTTDDGMNTDIQIYAGFPPELVGSYSSTNNGVGGVFMGGDPARPKLSRPIKDGDDAALFVGHQSDTELLIDFFRSSDFSQIRSWRIERPVASYQVVPTTTTPAVLANLEDGGCYIHKMDDPQPLLDRGNCKVRLGRDANGDEQPDAIRFGDAGLATIDLNLGAEIALASDRQAAAVGYRGRQLVAAETSGQTLTIDYLDSVELTPLSEALSNTVSGATFGPVTFLQANDKSLLFAQYEKGGFQTLRVLELGDSLRRLGEYGPYRELSWKFGPDLNGDGVPEIVIRGGSRPDGFNTDIDYRDPTTGQTVYEVGALRNVRFDAIWTNQTPAQPADIDGCEGNDTVLLRQGPFNDEAQRQTRVLFIDQDEVEVLRTETYTGAIHQLVLAELDGTPPFELVELRSSEGSNSILRILGPIGTD